MDSAPSAPEFKYWAFISYSHRDKVWGDWLHRSLETYRVPKRLVGGQSRNGPVPARVYPVFRDREELPVSSDLGTNIVDGLKQSRYLVVICSPNSAKSRWVNEEIRYFKALGREDRVLALIVDGEPNASAGKPGFCSEQECFPEALRFVLGADGRLSDCCTEPLAADVRPVGDGRHNAKLKLLAGILGVDFNALRQREHERQRRRLLAWLSISGAVSLAMGSLAAIAFYQRLQAQEQRAVADRQRKEAELQRQKAETNEHEARLRLAALYEERGRDELLKGEPGRAAPFLAAAYAENPDRATVKFLLATSIKTLEGQCAVLDGHLQSLVLAAYNQDGSRLATAERGGTVKVWNPAEGKLLRSFDSQQPDTPTKILFHEGSLFIAGQGTIRACDLATGKVRTFLHGFSPIHDLVLASDGSSLVSVSERNLQGEDATIKVWNIATGMTVSAFSHGHKTFSARLSKDGRRLLTTGDDAAACVWDLATKTKLLDLPHCAPPSRALWSPDEASIVTIGEKSGFCVWDAHTGRQTTVPGPDDMNPEVLEFNSSGDKLLIGGFARIGVMSWPAKAINPLEVEFKAFHARFSPDGKAVVVWPSSGEGVQVWSAESGQLLATLSGHASRPMDAVFSPDGRFIATVGMDQRGIVWDWKRLKGTPPIKTGFEYPVGAAAFGVDNLVVAKPLGAPHVCAWQSETGQLKASIDHPVDKSSGGLFNGLQTSLSRRVARLATAGPDRTARVWEYRNGRLLQTLQIGHRASAINLSSDGSKLLVSTGFNAAVWDVDSARPLLNFAGPFSNVSTVKLSPEANLALIADDAGVTAWSTQTGARIYSLSGHNGAVTDLKFTPQGCRVVTVGKDKTVRLWDAADGKQLGCFGPHGREVDLTAISSDNQIVATYGGSGKVLFWRCSDSTQLAQWETPSRISPRALVLWPQDHVAAVAVDSEIFYIDALTGLELCRFSASQNPITSLEFSPDGQTLLAGGEDRAIRFWPVSSQVGSPAEVQARLTRLGAWKLVNGHLAPRIHASDAGSGIMVEQRKSP